MSTTQPLWSILKTNSKQAWCYLLWHQAFYLKMIAEFEKVVEVEEDTSFDFEITGSSCSP